MYWFGKLHKSPQLQLQRNTDMILERIMLIQSSLDTKWHDTTLSVVLPFHAEDVVFGHEDTPSDLDQHYCYGF
jgi:hypothetical protein